MSKLVFGVVLGIACGLLAGVVMLPMPFPTPEDKKRAIAGAFLNRLVLGFVVANIALPMPSPLSGALLGFAVSAADAVITKAYVPILVIGTVLGALGAWLTTIVAH
jgi:hypothetical protein